MPRKCAATGRLMEAKDHASVQIAVADVDENGKMIPGSTTNIPISGAVRHQAESDDSINRIAQQMGCTYEDTVPTTLGQTGVTTTTTAHEPLLTVCAWLRDHSHFYGRGRIPHFHGAKRNRQRIRARRLLCMSLSSVRPLLHARYARCVVTSPGQALARYRQRTFANPAVMKNVWSYQQK